MSLTDISTFASCEVSELDRVANDFSIELATVNGSGSQTANMVLMRSIFQMGVPVSGKNLFPSNIQGLPTWFTIRASKHGYIGRKRETDFLVAMNRDTAAEDVKKLHAGAAVLYDAPLKLDGLRDDLHFYAVPYDELVAPVCPQPKLRKMVRNIIYDGVLAHLLGIDPEEIHKALFKQFGERKRKAADMNWNAVQVGLEYAQKNFEKKDPFWIERMNENRGKIIIEGNAATAIGCVFGGVSVCTWYPITPSSSVAESLIDYAGRFRMDEDGKPTFAIVQAEDELASIGMAIGAGWAGARSMTTTSGPGISLMAEFVGYAYYAEVPVVLFDVQRVGPSTGLPTRTMQGDLMFSALLSHGDTKHPLLIPSSAEECYSMAMEAFDLAESFQTPVFVMLDLDLGMNNWMSEPFAYPERPLDRGKVLTAEDLDRLGSFSRYRDVDGDGIPYRTLPYTNHSGAAYFTRGTGHNEDAKYSEREDDFVRNMERLSRKWETLRMRLPKPELDFGPKASIGIIYAGTSRYAVDESRDQLRNEFKLETSALRLKAYPFPPELEDFIDAHQRVYVVDQNRDRQLLGLMRLDLSANRISKLQSVRYFGGLPLDARTVTEQIIEQENA